VRAAEGQADHVVDLLSRQARTQRVHWMQASRLTRSPGASGRPLARAAFEARPADAQLLPPSASTSLWRV
jgi:hypothetical protein